MRRMFGFMIGIVVGALIGSTIALLLTPETGEKLRNEIRARGEVLVNDVAKLIGQFIARRMVPRHLQCRMQH